MTKQSKKNPAVYILSNKPNGTLYTGVTSDLLKRMYEHKNEIIKGFSSKYGCKNLVYFELYETMTAAIEREKQIKGGSRSSKIKIIESQNPLWNDLYKEII